MKYTHRRHELRQRERRPTKRARRAAGDASREKVTVSVERYTPTHDHEVCLGVLAPVWP